MSDVNGEDFIEKYADFLTGVPLNDELKAVQEGKISLVPHPVEQQKAADTKVAAASADKPLTHAERVQLRELRTSDGWPVLMRVLQKRFQNLEKSAITISQQNPLGNAQRVAEEWAYVMLYERVVREMEYFLEQELKTLEQER